MPTILEKPKILTIKSPIDILSVPTAENFPRHLLLDSSISNMQLEFQRASNERSFPKSGQPLARLKVNVQN